MSSGMSVPAGTSSSSRRREDRVLVAWTEYREPALRLASGVHHLIARLDEPVVLRPVVGMGALAAAARNPAVTLVLTDVLGWPGPMREWHHVAHVFPPAGSTNPVAAILRRSEREPAVRGLDALEVDRLLLPESRDAAAAALALLRRIHPPGAFRFLRCLPRGLDPIHDAAVVWAGLNVEKRPTPRDLAERCARDVERLEADLRRVGVPGARELLEAVRLCEAFRRLEVGAPRADAVGRCGFGEMVEFHAVCVRLTERTPDVLAGGGVDRVFALLGRRWGGGRPPVATPAVPAREIDSGPSDPDEAAKFEELYEKYRREIETGAREGGARDHEADDVVQDVFLGTLERRRKTGQDVGGGYLRNAGRNRGRNEARRRDRQHFSVTELDEGAFQRVEAERCGWDGPIHPPQQRDDLRALVRRLNEPARTVVRLRCDGGGWTHRDIGRLLGIVENTSAQVYSRATRQLQAMEVG